MGGPDLTPLARALAGADDNGVTDAQVLTAIELAVAEYSRHAPRLCSAEAVNGALPAEFEPTFSHTVSVTGTLVTFTALHTADTVPWCHRRVVAAFAAAHLLDGLASSRAGDRIATIPSDGISQDTACRNFASRARALREEFYASLGVKPDGSALAPASAPASAVGTMFPARRRGIGR